MTKWHPREHTKALRGMQSLTLEERGAYNTCLDLIYEREGPIPDDARWLAGWMGCSVRKWTALRAVLIVKGKLFDLILNGVPSLMNERAVIEIENQSERARVLAENGAKGGRKRGETPSKCNENNDEQQAPLKLITDTSTETDRIIADDSARAPDWCARLDEATAAGGDGLDRVSTGLMHAGDLRALCEPTSGEPCEWGEVLDAIRMCAARAKTRGKPIRSWSWVKDDAMALRDKRLNAALPPTEHPHERPHANAKFDAKQANYASAWEGSERAAGFRGKP